jgi:hypothetical protein
VKTGATTPATSTTKRSNDDSEAGQAALVPDVSVRSNSTKKSAEKDD